MRLARDAFEDRRAPPSGLSARGCRTGRRRRRAHEPLERRHDRGGLLGRGGGREASGLGSYRPSPHCDDERGARRSTAGPSSAARPGDGRLSRCPGLESFIAAAPWPQRLGLRVLLALVRRPRGAALLRACLSSSRRRARCSRSAATTIRSSARALGWDAAPSSLTRTRAAPPRGAAMTDSARRRRLRRGRRRWRGGRRRRAGRGRRQVVVLEQGPRHDSDGFTARPPEMLARLYRDACQTATRGSAADPAAARSRVGRHHPGQLRHLLSTPPHVLERWAAEFGLEIDEATLRPCFERVEQRAVGRPRSRPSWPAPTRRWRGAAPSGWAGRTDTCAATRAAASARECASSAAPPLPSSTPGITYIPRAAAAGARIVTGADVQEILIERGRARGVSARLADGRAPGRCAPRGGGRLRHHPHPVAAARAAGWSDPSGQRGRNLALHPATVRVRAHGRGGRHGARRAAERVRRRVRLRGLHVRGRRRAAGVCGDGAPAHRRPPFAGDGRLSPARPVRADGQRRVARPRPRGRWAAPLSATTSAHGTCRSSAPVLRAWRSCSSLRARARCTCRCRVACGRSAPACGISS